MREKTISRDSGRASCARPLGARKGGRRRGNDSLSSSPDHHTLETTRSPTRQRHRFFPEKRPKRDSRAVVTPQTAQRAGNHQPRPPRRKGKKEESDPLLRPPSPAPRRFAHKQGRKTRAKWGESGARSCRQRSSSSSSSSPRSSSIRGK
jgi:hypothetical protein